MSLHKIATDRVDDPLSFKARSIDWHPSVTTRQTALFRCYSDRVAVLQHIRTISVDCGPTPSGCKTDTAARPVDVPDDVLDKLRGEGYEIVAGRSP